MNHNDLIISACSACGHAILSTTAAAETVQTCSNYPLCDPARFQRSQEAI